MMTTATTISIPTIGATMPDGSIYAGVSPDTGNSMFTTREDVTRGFFGLRRHFCLVDAFAAASKLKAHGRQDWRLPTKAELKMLFQNRAAIGGFDTTGSDPAGWYWSSTRNLVFSGAYARRFRDGNPNNGLRDRESALRCVRG